MRTNSQAVSPSHNRISKLSLPPTPPGQQAENRTPSATSHMAKGQRAEVGRERQVSLTGAEFDYATVAAANPPGQRSEDRTPSATSHMAKGQRAEVGRERQVSLTGAEFDYATVAAANPPRAAFR